MPGPTLDDDGATVTLDLHHLPLHEAIDLACTVVAEASAYGRDRVKIIHGSSTSDPAAHNPTIKHRLLDLLDGGELEHYVVDSLAREDELILSLGVTRSRNPRRLRLIDLW